MHDPLELHDLPVQAYQLELLEQAYAAASSFPVNPHIKNRCRAQEQVALAAVALGQFDLARRYADQVLNWRRGMVYAAIAEALLDRGEVDHIDTLLERAMAHGIDADQGWRQSMVRARVASVRMRMGQTGLASQTAEGLEGPALRTLAQSQARVVDDEAFDALLASLNQMVATQDYDAIKAALDAYAHLYGRYYADPARRAAVDQAMREAWEPMPALDRINTLFKCIDAAVAHDDPAHGLELVDEAQSVKDSHAWSADFDLPLTADLAKHRFRVGDVSGTRRRLDDAVSGADTGLESLQNFQRADALRPLAEAYAELGDRERAIALYGRVIELGAVNPNLRPRVSDIVSSCTSMALHQIEPTESLRQQVTTIVSGLGHP